MLVVVEECQRFRLVIGFSQTRPRNSMRSTPSSSGRAKNSSTVINRSATSGRVATIPIVPVFRKYKSRRFTPPGSVNECANDSIRSPVHSAILETWLRAGKKQLGCSNPVGSGWIVGDCLGAFKNISDSHFQARQKRFALQALISMIHFRTRIVSVNSDRAKPWFDDPHQFDIRIQIILNF